MAQPYNYAGQSNWPQTNYNSQPPMGAFNTGQSPPWMVVPQATQSTTNPVQNPITSPMQPPSLPGRVVNAETDIIPNEVPMDGSVGFFVQADLQRIYAKTWGRDRNIHTNTYELVSPGNPDALNAQNGIDLILERLDKLEQSIKKNQGRPYHKNNNRKPKQEGEKQE